MCYLNFNTSHVNVNPISRVKGICKDIISIHLMLMLIAGMLIVEINLTPISIHLMLMLIEIL